MTYLYCLLDTEGLTVHYDLVEHCLYNTWKGTHTQASIQENAGLIASGLRAHPCRCILSDHTQLRSPWEHSPTLVSTTLGRLAGLGVQRFAWVPSVHHSLDRAAMAAAHYSTLSVGIFTSVSEASAWLHQEHNTSSSERNTVR